MPTIQVRSVEGVPPPLNDPLVIAAIIVVAAVILLVLALLFRGHRIRLSGHTSSGKWEVSLDPPVAHYKPLPGLDGRMHQSLYRILDHLTVLGRSRPICGVAEQG